MNANKPLRHGYFYQKKSRPPEERDETTILHRYRQAGLVERIQPLYEAAGCPFGDADVGLLLWLAFGRRTHSN